MFREVGPAEVRAEALAAEAREARTQSLLQLRRSLHAVDKDVRSSAADVRRRRQLREQAEAAEFDRLLREGKNPYAEFRKRHRDRAEAKMAKEAVEAVERARLNMADAIVVEDAAARRRERLAKTREREAAALALPHGGGQAAGQYLAQHTRGGADVLDPTGRTARIDASVVTTLRTHAFGTGKVAKHRPDILLSEKRRPEMRGVVPDERWLPRRLPHPDEPAQGGAAGLGEEAAAARGAADLTPLEQRLMAAARERLRAGRVHRQVVLGREFKGYSMVADPRRVEFRDFEPGQPHRLRLTLTNGSLSFVSFRIAALPDAIADMFDVVFTPPGRMSAGTSVPITIHFRPPASLDDDVVAELPVDTSTGPCPVPLLCSPKRALPAAADPVGSAGPVVLGEVAKAAVTLSNEGALPVLWQVTDLGPADGVGELDTPTVPDADGQPLGDGADGELRQAGDSPWHVRASGRLAGYAKSVLRAECRPGRGTALGRCARLLSVSFRVDTGGSEAAEAAEDEAGAMLQTLDRTSAARAVAQAKPAKSLGEQAEAAEAQSRARLEVRRRRARMRLPPLRVLLTAEVRPLPLFVSPAEVDLRVCECPLPPGTPGLLPRPEEARPLYRGTVHLRNRGKTAVRAALSLPPALHRWVQLQPTSCYVQAPGTLLPGASPTDPGLFRVSMRLRPDVGLLTDPDCRRFFVDAAAPRAGDLLPASRGDAATRLRSPQHVASGETPGSFCELTVPVTVRGAGQALSVSFRMRAAVCLAGLLVAPTRVAVGSVPIGRASGFPLRLTNLSLLPARFGPSGARVPRGFWLAGGSGQGVLLGGESGTASVVFSPQSTEQVSGALSLRTSHGSTHRVLVSGCGARALATLGATRLCLPATSPGETVEAAVPIEAATGSPVEVHILGAGRSAGTAAAGLPPGFTVSPAVFTLLPGERRLVRVVYAPTSLAVIPPSVEDDREAAEDEGDREEAEDEGEAGQDDGDGGDLPSARSGPAASTASEARPSSARSGARGEPGGAGDASGAAGTQALGGAIDPGVCETRLWIAVRPASREGAKGAEEELKEKEEGAAAASGGVGGDGASQFDAEAAAPLAELGPRGQLLALDVQTSVTAARLSAEPRVVRLGQVPAGRQVTAAVKVECTGALPVTVEAAGLNPAGAFRVVNAPRVLQPGKSARLTISFTPASSRVYTDQLRLRAAEGGGTIIVRLAGSGATPDVSLLPGAAGDAAEGGTGRALLDLLLGDVVSGDEARAPARLRNSSPFPMTFAVATPDAVAHSVSAGAVSGRAGFSVTPSAGTAAPGADLPLEVVLRTDAPSRGRWLRWRWAVRVPNYEGPPLAIAARARVWPTQAFVARESDTGDSAPAGLRRVAEDLCGQAAPSDAEAFDADGAAAVRLALDGTRAEARAAFVVGCCARPEGADSSPVSFTVTRPSEEDCPGAARIRVAPESGTVQPGETLRVELTVAPAAAGAAGSGASQRADAAGALAALLPQTKPAREVLVPLRVELTAGTGRKQAVAVAVEARLPSV